MTGHLQEFMRLRCRVTPGMFDHEVGVEGRQTNGSVWSLFAPKEKVDYGCLPLEGPVEGWIHVRALEREGDHVLVELPGETFQNGAYVTVLADELQARLQKQKV